MKLHVLILAIIASLFGGCSLLTKPVVTRVPVELPGATNVVVITNQPPPVVVTNTVKGETVYVTNTPPAQVVTNVVVVPPAVHYVTVTNLVARPELLGAIDTAKQVNASLNPTPTGPFINWGLTLAAGAASALAAWQNSRAKGAKALLDTVITGVETSPFSGGTKEQIAKVAAIKGTADALDKVVQAVTATVADAVPDPKPSGKLTADQLLSYAQNPKITSADLPPQYVQAFEAIRSQLKS